MSRGEERRHISLRRVLSSFSLRNNVHIGNIFFRHRSQFHSRWRLYYMVTQIAKFMGPTWGQRGSCRPQMDPMLAPWNLLSGKISWCSMCLGLLAVLLHLRLGKIAAPYTYWQFIPLLAKCDHNGVKCLKVLLMNQTFSRFGTFWTCFC